VVVVVGGGELAMVTTAEMAAMEYVEGSVGVNRAVIVALPAVTKVSWLPLIDAIS
jgi:hypothetical protein